MDQDGEGSRLSSTALFDPLGLEGQLYWWFLFPIHKLIFRGMLRAVVRKAQAKKGS